MSYIQRMNTRMECAVQQGSFVVVQPTFPTIPEKHEPKLSNWNERCGLNDVFGQAAAEWQQRQNHEMFRVGSLDRLITVVRSFRDLAQEHSKPLSLLNVSKHGCIVPWSSFFLNDSEEANAAQTNGRLHIRSVFGALNNSAARQTYRNLIPSLAPALRVGLSAIEMPAGKELKSEHVSTNSLRMVAFEGEVVRLRDMLVVPDPELKGKIEDAETFSFVATPYLQRWSLREGVESAKKHRLGQIPEEDMPPRPVCMFWHIGDERQLSFDQ